MTNYVEDYTVHLLSACNFFFVGQLDVFKFSFCSLSQFSEGPIFKKWVL